MISVRFILIEARDLNDAMQVAAKFSLTKQGSIDVRPSRSSSDEVHVHHLPR